MNYHAGHITATQIFETFFKHSIVRLHSDSIQNYAIICNFLSVFVLLTTFTQLLSLDVKSNVQLS
jgi:hypothetical protein